jgi:adenylate kinase family enzyme
MRIGPRISVIGMSGSGKTRTAALVASALGVPHVELDSIRHGPGWTETPDDEFRRIVTERTNGESWVVDGNYSAIVRDIIWERATDVVWLAYPRRTVMRQVIKRSLARAAFRTELWNGNRERWRHFLEPYHPVRWAWTNHASHLERDAMMLAEERYAHVRVVRLHDRAETSAWLAGLRPS